MMIESFLDYLKYERNYSSLTTLWYKGTLEEFEAYFGKLDNHLSWKTVDSDIIRRWMEDMMDGGTTSATVKKKLSAIRSFFRFALKKGIVDKDPAFAVTSPRVKKPLPLFMKESEMEHLLDGSAMWGEEYDNVRARTIILLLYETGIRASELIGIDDVDVDTVNRQLKVTGKRNKQRVIPFGEELAGVMETYMSMRDTAEEERNSNALFVGTKGKRLRYDQLRRIVVDNLSKVTTMKKRSPHVLRHTFATTMLNNGAGLESIRELLGHESLNTTEVYTHTTFEQLKRVYNNAHPRA